MKGEDRKTAKCVAVLLPASVLLASCAHGELRLTPEVLQERMLRPDRSLSLCDFNLQVGSSAFVGPGGALLSAMKTHRAESYAGQLKTELSGIYEGALSRSGGFPFVPRSKLVGPRDGKPIPAQAIADSNGLHACLAVKSSLLALNGWDKKVGITTTWELTGRSGWKMALETKVSSREAHGVLADPRDPKLRPVFVELARESAASFLAGLTERGMLQKTNVVFPSRAPAATRGSPVQAQVQNP